MTFTTRRISAVLPTMLALISGGVTSAADMTPAPTTASSLGEALRGGSFSGFARYRLDSMLPDDDVATKDSVASTLRLQLGYQTMPYRGFQAGLELFNVAVIGDDIYNYLGNSKQESQDQANINDPKDAGISAAWVSWKGDLGGPLAVKVGRQAFTINDEYLLTYSWWRQSQNLFDAATAVWNPRENTTITAGLLAGNRDVFSQYHRLNGVVLNAAYSLPDKGTVSAYLVDLNYKDGETLRINPSFSLSQDGNDTRSIGLRAQGPFVVSEDLKILYAADVMTQSAVHDNPGADGEALYYLLEAGVNYKGNSVVLAYNHRDGNDAGDHNSIKIPVGYPYPYRGETEQFVVTPGEGLEILMLKAVAKVPTIDTLTVNAAYWSFAATETSADYGSEFAVGFDYDVPEVKGLHVAGVAAWHDADDDTTGGNITAARYLITTWIGF